MAYHMAARMGDPTVHGGVIITGAPTVLIGGQPAARISDFHTCPIAAPGAPPHVGGIIISGAPNVLITGLPASRMSDNAVCVGPLDIIAAGCPTVFIGGKLPVTTGGGPVPPPPRDLVTEREEVQREIDEIDDRLDSIQREIYVNRRLQEAAPGGGMNPPRQGETWWQGWIRMMGEMGEADPHIPDGADIAVGDAHRTRLQERNDSLEQEATDLRSRRSELHDQLDDIDGSADDGMIG